MKKLIGVGIACALLTGCVSTSGVIKGWIGGELPTELAVNADCYVPTFYQDETNKSGRSYGLNVQYNYDLCEALISHFRSLAPTVMPGTSVLPEGLVSFGGQLGGRFGVDTLTGFDNVVISEKRAILPSVNNVPVETSSLQLLPLMYKARKLANSRAHRKERTEQMYKGSVIFHEKRSEYFQALNAMSLTGEPYTSKTESTLLMVVSGQLLGESYAKAKYREVTSKQMTSNILGAMLAGAAGVASSSEYTTTTSRLYMTFLFVNSEGEVEYANVTGSKLCEDPSASARLLAESAFQWGVLSENRLC